jgi:simple sugar transport system substrate-binding protein
MVSASRWVALVATVVTVAGIAGCGGSSGPKGTNIVLVAPGPREDADLTTEATAAVKKVAARYHVRAVIVDGATTPDLAATLRRLAPHAQLIVVPYAGDRAAATRVAADTKVPTLVWGDPRALRKGQLADVQWAAADGAYAAGTMAVHASVYKSAGIVICDNAEPLEMAQRYRMAAAFVAGARAENPKVRLFYTRTGDGGSVSVAQAKAATKKITLDQPVIHVASTQYRLDEPGAEFVFGLCGPAGPGVMQGVLKAGEEHQYVAVIGDQKQINQANMLLTSILVHVTIPLEQAVRDVRAGRFGSRLYSLEFGDRSMSLLRTGRTPADAYEAAIARASEIVKHQASPPDVSTDEGVRALVAKAS